MGKKSVLIKRIITFLETGDKPVTPSKKKGKGKRTSIKKNITFTLEWKEI